MRIFLFAFSLWLASSSFAQSRPTRYQSTSLSKPAFTYDLGLSSGKTNDKTYTEVQLGLNWNLSEYLAWRNALFTRFGSGIESTSGLDTSARLNYNSDREPGEFGIGVFAGPGLRISKKENTGVFGEAGVTLKGPGLAIGAVVKSIHYPAPADGEPKNETVVSLILGASGAL